MDTSHMAHQNQPSEHEMAGNEGDGSAMAMHSMEGHHMDMGPHMKHEDDAASPGPTRRPEES
jgi:hypothetical protein